MDIRLASPPPQPFTRRPRDPAGIRQIQWHATRGAISMDRQVSATESWFASPANNRGGWGGSADFVVGPDHRQGGRVVIVQFEDPWNSFGSWSAGYGGAHTLPAAPHGIAIEVAQPAGRDRLGNYTGAADANFEQYTDETIDACRWLVGHINAELTTRDVEPVPPVWIDGWDQASGRPIPRGHIGHENLANGKKLGKHDPGHLFPRDALMASLLRATTRAADSLAGIRALHESIDTKVIGLQSVVREVRSDLAAMEVELARLGMETGDGD